MDRDAFQKLVRRAADDLPAEVHDVLANVEIVVKVRPSRKLLRSLGFDPEEDTLLGFYEGVPITDRVGDGATGVEPVTDTIFIFQEPLEEMCETLEELEDEVRATIVHEVAHHFGLDEDEVDRLGYG